MLTLEKQLRSNLSSYCGKLYLNTRKIKLEKNTEIKFKNVLSSFCQLTLLLTFLSLPQVVLRKQSPRNAVHLIRKKPVSSYGEMFGKHL